MGCKMWEVAKFFEPQPYTDRRAFIVSGTISQSALPSYLMKDGVVVHSTCVEN